MSDKARLNIFKVIHNSIKLRRLDKIVRELCDGRSCRNCPACIRDSNQTHCALSRAIELALENWGLNMDDWNAYVRRRPK